MLKARKSNRNFVRTLGLKAGNAVHLVVVKGASHVLASNILHKDHLLVGLHDLNNLWGTTRNFLFAAGPA